MKIYCITTKDRKDRKTRIKRQAKKLNLNIEFCGAKLNKLDPVKGCRDSHVNVIKMARDKKLKNVVIIEDDAHFLQSLDNVINPPDDFDLVYYGAKVERLESGKGVWKSGSFSMAFAYCVNSSIYDKIINDAPSSGMPMDIFYEQIIGRQYKCYLHTPIVVTQRNDYSDITRQNEDYSFLEKQDYNPVYIDSTKTEIKNGNCILKLPHIELSDLPKVSIVTPTYNRKKFFELAINNWKKTDYPQDKLEWIIVDDSDDTQALDDILPKDPRIKYIRINDPPRPRKVGEKRNICVEYARGDIIVHMDDDDYYFPTHVLSRVKVLAANSGKQCVGCTRIGSYDIMSGKSFSCGEGIKQANAVGEASFAYYRTFWEIQKFNDKSTGGEYTEFLSKRYNQVVQMPYNFVMIAFTHKTNTTGRMRTIPKEYNLKDFTDYTTVIPQETMELLENIK